MSQGTGGGGRGRRITCTRGLAAPGRRGWGLGLVAAWLLWLSWAGMGHGAPGDLDPTFGTGGIAITFGPSDFANALVVQPDGKLVVAGTSSGDGVNHVLLARYLPNGRGDGSFGPGGKITTTVGSHSGANAVLQQPDGKLVVAGSVVPSSGGPSDVLLARFLPDGRLDASFGTAGIVTTHFVANNLEEANALLLQPDGKLVVAGRSNILGTPFPSAILARYLPDGRLDPSFGIEGKVTLTFGGGSGINALVQQPDGKLAVAGFGGLSRVTASCLVLARFQPDGRVDPTFGEGGKVTLASSSGGQALIQQSDGTLAVAGSFSTSSGSGLLLVRYLPDGRLDPTFGTAGVVITDVSVPAFPRALIQQPDGKARRRGVSSASGPATCCWPLPARWPPGSRLWCGGPVITDVGGGEILSALLQQPDGTLVAAGSFSARWGHRYTPARYQALGCPTGDPEPCQASLADRRHRRLPRLPWHVSPMPGKWTTGSTCWKLSRPRTRRATCCM